jgi:hypothetical protein
VTRPPGQATRNGRPRPPGFEAKITPEIHEKIVDVVASGCTMESAAAYAGVNTWTFRDWLRNGRKDLELRRNNRYTRLVEAIEQARAQTEITRVARIAKAGMEGDWKADAWYLEHAMQDKYAVIRMKHEGTISVQPQPLVDWETLTVEEAETLLALLRKGAPNADDPALTQAARPALELVEGDGFTEVE